MKKMRIGLFLFWCAVSGVFGQTNDAAFFRISSPSNAVITQFDLMAGTITWSNGVAGVTNQLQRAYDLIGTSNWVDFVQLVSTGAVSSEKIIDLSPPEGMAYIPGGSFSMGDNLDGLSSAQPVHSVYVNGFYMGKTEVTKAQWDEVYKWAIANGYSFDHAGSGKASNHPVHTVSWYDVVKWCNARSEKENKTPCYNLSTWSCNYNANGYRLPTEAEWEKAARGNLSGKRFPWGDTIQHTRANYISSTSYSYDASSTRGDHPTYHDGVSPYTSPVGSFAPNGYGLYEMAGNEWEWCGDWYDGAYYGTSPSSNPRGASSGSRRVLRGGCYGNSANLCRAANRFFNRPGFAPRTVGFRVVLPPGQ
ncbi:Serine/threonine-protein kinase pkn1 [Pontiella desulfatans]|uniref:Serine/threonine-protein kinase pkn1 n=1 Tax=Pontiella desulfatans TaxID=2750659 RepID=A0A6C2U1N2_PONDE|nr:formylglycine-generating enzyme family protein [Pontiella desulfatans]VGO13719.1 Serine/threonine-protein kinase pkn1 [Pontiella desulfatans]